MATHDYVIDNQSAPNFRSDLNNALAAIVSTNSNSTAPSTTFANMQWVDTTANQLKIRNEDNDAWIVLADLDQTGDTSAPPDASITFAKLAAATVVTSGETIASNNNDTTLPTSAAVKAYGDGLVTSDTVRNAMSSANAGEVGTFALLRLVTLADAVPGATFSGASLTYASASGATTGTPSGTWRLMGRTDNGSEAGSTSLFLRIS